MQAAFANQQSKGDMQNSNFTENYEAASPNHIVNHQSYIGALREDECM